MVTRSIAKAYLARRDEPETQALMSRVNEYDALLRSCGLRDHQVRHSLLVSDCALVSSLGLHSLGSALRKIVTRCITLLVMLVLLLPGLVINMPIVVLTRVLSEKRRKEALAVSTVKLHASDVLATWKMIVASIVVPVVLTLWSVIVTLVLLSRSSEPGNPLALFTPVASGCLFLSFGSVYGLESLGDLAKSLRPLLFVLFSSKHCLLLLQMERDALSQEIQDVFAPLVLAALHA